MNLRSAALVTLGTLMLATPALGLHSPGNGVFTTDTGIREFNVPLLANAVWWDQSSVLGVPTGLNHQTHMFEVDRNTAPIIITAETFPVSTPDTPKLCLPVSTPTIFVAPLPGTAIVHPVSCVKENGYSVQIHYFPWESGVNDPDHVISISASTPLATTQWRVDAVPLSYKVAVIPAGFHGTVWIDPAVATLEYRVQYRATSSAPFYFDYLGTRGCPFHTSDLVAGLNDSNILGCKSGFV